MKQEEYIISGMSCAACSASVQRVVSRLEGVESCDVNLITGKMTVSYDEEKTGQADFTRVVEKAGFGIRPDTPEETEKPKAAEKKKGCFGGIIGVIALHFNGANADGQAARSPVYEYFGRPLRLCAYPAAALHTCNVYRQALFHPRYSPAFAR